MRTKLGALAVVVLALAAPPALARVARSPLAPALSRGSHAPPRVLDSPGDFVARPPFMSFALGNVGGDAVDYFYGPGLTGPEAVAGHTSRVHWSSWGARATADGTLLSQECKVRKGRQFDCVRAFSAEPDQIILTRVRGGHYTRLRFKALARTRFRFSETYALRSVPGDGGQTGIPGSAWCARVSPKVCLGP
jgi:hypothetical protein